MAGKISGSAPAVKGSPDKGGSVKGGSAVKIVKKVTRNDVKDTVVRTGTVTAVRWDGTVNLQLGGQRFPGVACASSYSSRNAGDRVQVIVHGGMPFVLGAVGEDPDAPAPEIYPNDQAQYTWGNFGTTGREVRLYVNEGQNQRVGRPGSLQPVFPGDDFYQVCYSYWDGSTNTMVALADLTQQIDIFLGRDDWDEGDPGPAQLSLWPQKADLPPFDPQNFMFPAVDPLYINFTLEAGELKVITLPDSWRDNIGAVTPDSGTIRGFLIRPAANGTIPFAMDNSYAILNSISGSLRIYSQ